MRGAIRAGRNRPMHMRYLLALAAVPGLMAVARAQGTVEPPPPPTPPPPTAAPAPTPAAPAPAVPGQEGPPPTAAPVPPAPGNETLPPDFAAPAATLSSTPDVIDGVLPKIPGSDALPSQDGPVGLLRVSAAEVGAP